MGPTTTRYLSLAREALGMDLAWLSEHTGPDQVMRALDGDARRFNVSQGDALSWEGSFCTRVLDQRLPAFIPDAAANPVAAALPATGYMGIGSYVGTPVRLPDGRLYGMLCCVSREPHRELRDHHVHLLAAFAASLGQELGDEAIRRGAPESALTRIPRAIRGKGLRMVLQPIVTLHTMRIAGVEALARFDGPPGRPDEWFAEAVDLGMGLSLEMAAVKAALALLDELPPETYLSVTVSPAALCSPDLAQALETVDARRVVVELTEHSSVAEYERLLASVDRLRRGGVRLAVDAGAGYASFRHILSLRPDIIKFDRHMVTQLDVDPARRALVEALVSFGAQMGATLVAEGVETAGELDVLTRLGVACGQGYLLARPAPLPLPEIRVRPASIRRDAPDEADGEPAPPLEQAMDAVLREVVDRTGLEASFLNVWDAERRTLEPRVAYDPQRLGVRAGVRLPWSETSCYRCREAGILWTSDAEKDLGGLVMGRADLRTFVSVPVENGAGEMIGTLCATGRERRYLSDPVLDHVQHLAAHVATLLARADGPAQAR